MTDPQRSLPSPEWSGFRDFLDGEVDRSPVLVCPLRDLWRAYLAHCAAWGFARADAVDFVAWMREEEGVEVRQGGSGRIRRMVLGMAPRAQQ